MWSWSWSTPGRQPRLVGYCAEVAGAVQLIYDDALRAYRHSEDHPLQPLRVQLTVETIRGLDLLAGCELVSAREATDDEICLVHEPTYVDLVRSLSLPGASAGPEARRRGFGSGDNPVFPDMHRASALVVGASILAAEAAHEGRAQHVFSPAGGLHHAKAALASGFCVYNDAATAIAWLRQRGHRVAYVDVDVHHGDGTEAIFWADPEVLTISLHESGRYLFPGTGFPDETGSDEAKRSSANLPFEPLTWDDPWLAGFEAVVPPLLRRFRPSVLVTQNGCDTHRLDPLADLICSTRIWPRMGRIFHELVHELCDGRWVALGGGGYAIREVVPRAWALLFAEMVERPDRARGLLDEESFHPDPANQDRVWNALERDLDDLRRAHGL